MKYTLKGFQESAVVETLDKLQKAQKGWKDDKDLYSLSLTATTGAGKTVMAAAVFEALFFGNDEYNFEPDSTAVVLWFSDNPSLNEQSLYELERASDKLGGHLRTISDDNFDQEKLERGKIYFLNTQKLSSKSNLLKSGTDRRVNSFWDTLRNTLLDESLTTYLLLDEAHRGMKNDQERPTIVRSLINGSNGDVPPIPIVLGISATVERFNRAMEASTGRTKLPDVLVETGKVQEEGLLKDTVTLDIPEETGAADTVLLRRAADKFKEKSESWIKYVEAQQDVPPVHSLLVLQVPDNPSHDQIGKYLKIIFENVPDLRPDMVANVFGEHKEQIFGKFNVPYVSPERIQETTQIRVVIAKDAISTGWNCPRAEVMISFRPAKDKTYITQLLGRITRTPLARRIPGYENLNTVDCVLPKFNRAVTENVINVMLHGEDASEQISVAHAPINPVKMLPNSSVSKDFWSLFESLPSYLLPRKETNPIKRLTSLAHELAKDDLLKDAGKKAQNKMHKALDGAKSQYQDEIMQACENVKKVTGSGINIDVRAGEYSSDEFTEHADSAVIDEAYRQAIRIFSKPISDTYASHLAKGTTQEAMEEALQEARITIAGMACIDDVGQKLNDEARGLSEKWFTDHRASFKSLSDARQEKYKQIERMSNEPLEECLVKPDFIWQQPDMITDRNEIVPLPIFSDHLYCDPHNKYPVKLNEWETHIVKNEMHRTEIKFWYRNQLRSKSGSLAIPYVEGDTIKLMFPDFIFFGYAADGLVAADIIDPHGPQYADALPKLIGLADYAEKHSGIFRRIEGIAKLGDEYRVLDLTSKDVRLAVRSASSAKALYEGQHAKNY